LFVQFVVVRVKTVGSVAVWEPSVAEEKRNCLGGRAILSAASLALRSPQDDRPGRSRRMTARGRA